MDNVNPLTAASEDGDLAEVKRLIDDEKMDVNTHDKVLFMMYLLRLLILLLITYARTCARRTSSQTHTHTPHHPRNTHTHTHMNTLVFN